MQTQVKCCNNALNAGRGINISFLPIDGSIKSFNHTTQFDLFVILRANKRHLKINADTKLHQMTELHQMAKSCIKMCYFFCLHLTAITTLLSLGVRQSYHYTTFILSLRIRYSYHYTTLLSLGVRWSRLTFCNALFFSYVITILHFEVFVTNIINIENKACVICLRNFDPACKHFLRASSKSHLSTWNKVRTTTLRFVMKEFLNTLKKRSERRIQNQNKRLKR